MPTRLWMSVNRTGQVTGVLSITDEKALEMLERNPSGIRPLDRGLVATIATELETAA